MRGIFAKVDIKVGETLLFVPEKIVVTLEKAISTPFGKEIISQELIQFREDNKLGGRLHLPTYAMLAMFNMQERAKGK